MSSGVNYDQMMNLASQYLSSQNSGGQSGGAPGGQPNMYDSATQLAAMSGNPEIAIGVQAAKAYGSYNTFYTFVIGAIFLILLLWFFLGSLAGSEISVDEGIDWAFGSS